MSEQPSSRSRRATWGETLDWTVWRPWAAAENEPWSATATTALSWRRSIAQQDSEYQRNALDRLHGVELNNSRTATGVGPPPPPVSSRTKGRHPRRPFVSFS